MTAWEKRKHEGVVAPGTRGAAWTRLGAAAISRMPIWQIPQPTCATATDRNLASCLAICHPRARMARLLLGVAVSL